MKRLGWKSGKAGGLGILMLAIFIAVLAAFLVAPYVQQYLQPQALQQMPVAPQQPSQPQQPAQAPAGFIFGQIQDIDTAAALGSAKVDVIDPASNKLLETITADSNGKFTSVNVYEPGKSLLLHIYSTGYYDKEFTVKVPSTYTLVSNSYYYPLGVYQLKKRVAADSISFKIQDPTGTTLGSADGDTAQSSGFGSYTASSTSFNLMLLISVTGTVSQPVAFGEYMPYVTPQLQKEQLKPVVWVAFNSTAINLDKLRSAGFERMENAPSGVLVVYKVLSPIETNKINTAQTMSVQIPVDTSSIASGTKVAMAIWIADLQRPADAAIGVKISSLTAYGPYSGYGVTSPLGQGYTAPSSSTFGNSDGWLRLIITTA